MVNKRNVQGDAFRKFVVLTVLKVLLVPRSPLNDKQVSGIKKPRLIENITLIVLYVYCLVLRFLLIDEHSVISQFLNKRTKHRHTQDLNKSLLVKFYQGG